MRYINVFVSILFILLLSCSFPTTSGTGHEGEARIMGIAYTSTGVYRNGRLFIASEEYLPTTSRSSVEGREIITDGEGRFDIAIEKDAAYILSGKINGEYLYEKVSTAGELELGSVYYEKGSAVTVHPAGTADTTYTHLLVSGTDWVFDLPANSSTTIALPQESVSVVRRGSYQSENGPVSFDNADIIDVNESTVIGDEPLPDSIAYTFTDSISLSDTCFLEVTNVIDGDQYEMDWGDSTIQSDSTGSFIHFYSSVGTQYFTLTRMRNGKTDRVDNTIIVTPQ